MSEIERSNEYSKDTAYIIEYFNKRFNSIEKDMKIQLLLLQRLTQAVFQEKLLRSSPINKTSSKLNTKNLHPLNNDNNFNNVLCNHGNNIKQKPSTPRISDDGKLKALEIKGKSEMDSKLYSTKYTPVTLMTKQKPTRLNKSPLKNDKFPVSTKHANKKVKPEVFKGTNRTPIKSRDNLELLVLLRKSQLGQ